MIRMRTEALAQSEWRILSAVNNLDPVFPDTVRGGREPGEE